MNLEWQKYRIFFWRLVNAFDSFGKGTCTFYWDWHVKKRLLCLLSIFGADFLLLPRPGLFPDHLWRKVSNPRAKNPKRADYWEAAEGKNQALKNATKKRKKQSIARAGFHRQRGPRCKKRGEDWAEKRPSSEIFFLTRPRVQATCSSLLAKCAPLPKLAKADIFILYA